MDPAPCACDCTSRGENKGPRETEGDARVDTDRPEGRLGEADTTLLPSSVGPVTDPVSPGPGPSAVAKAHT